MPNKAIRFARWIVLLVPIAALLVYGFILFLSVVEWRQNANIHTSTLTELRFLLLDALIGAGIAPLAISIYFFGLQSGAKAWGAGLGFLLAFLAAHYVGSVFLAHEVWHIGVPVLLGEVLAAVLVITWWHRRSRKPNEAAQA